MQLSLIKHRQAHQVLPFQTGKLNHDSGFTTSCDTYTSLKGSVPPKVHFGVAQALTEYTPGRLSLYEIQRAVDAYESGTLPSNLEYLIPRLVRIIDEASNEQIPIKPVDAKWPKNRSRSGGVDSNNVYMPGQLSAFELGKLGQAFNIGFTIPDDLKWLARYCASEDDNVSKAVDQELAENYFVQAGLKIMSPILQNLPALLQFIESVDASEMGKTNPEYFESQKAYITEDLKKSQHTGQYFMVTEKNGGRIIALIVCHEFTPREGLEGILRPGQKALELNSLYVHPDYQGHRKKIANRSLATALHEAMEERTRIEGKYDCILLETSTLHKRSAHFYEKMGYRKVTTTTDDSGNEFWAYLKEIKH